MKRVFIIHGYTGHPNTNWFPWLKKELEKLNILAIIPEMPNAENPQLSEWLPYLQLQVSLPDKDTYFVGHSLGCITILKYIESIPENTKVGGALLVAGFASPIHFSELDNFFSAPLNDNKIKENILKIININSDNDNHVPFIQAEEIRDRFNSELITIHNGGHLNDKAGYTEFPLLLEELKKIIA